MFLPIGDTIERFSGFGPSRLASGRQPAAAEIQLAAEDSASRKLLRTLCPDEPGVYGMIDAEGRLIYVGKSKSLRARLVSYLSGSSLDSKSRRIISCTRRIVWEPGPHEFVALLRELELIRRFCPRFNVRGRPGRGRRAYVAMERGPAPHAHLTEKASPRDRVLVGPLWPGPDLRRMVRVLNDCFGLRDCPGRIAVAFAEQQEMFAGRSAPGCIRYELGTCLGPCTGACTSRRYGDHVRRARAFLCGTDRSMLARLEQAMRAAAAAERFQCAASIRDQWRDLTALDELLGRVRTVERTYSFVYPLPAYRSGETWYLIDRGQVVGSVAVPGSPRSAQRAMGALEKAYPSWGTLPTCRGHNGTLATCPTLRVDHAAPDDPDLILLVSLWFRAHPEQLGLTIAPEAAKCRCLESVQTLATR